jgi:hypothetical protein
MCMCIKVIVFFTLYDSSIDLGNVPTMWYLLFIILMVLRITYESLIVLLIKYITTVRDGALKKKGSVLFIDNATHIVKTNL